VCIAKCPGPLVAVHEQAGRGGEALLALELFVVVPDGVSCSPGRGLYMYELSIETLKLMFLS